MKNQEIKFKSKNQSYSVVIGKNALQLLPKKIKLLCPKTKKIALIVDKNVSFIFKTELNKKLKNYSLLFVPFAVKKIIHENFRRIFKPIAN